MLEAAHIKARLPRLRQRMAGLARELDLWREQDGPLLPFEKHRYLAGIQEALAGLEKAHVVLEAATRRIDLLMVLDYRGP